MRLLGQPIALQLANARVLVEQELRETYFSGKSTVEVSRDYQSFLVGTTPTLDGDNMVFVRCSGNVSVTPDFAGTLSMVGDIRIKGIC